MHIIDATMGKEEGETELLYGLRVTLDDGQQFACGFPVRKFSKEDFATLLRQFAAAVERMEVN